MAGLTELPRETLDWFEGDELRARVFFEKYALQDLDGTPLELTPDEMWERIAKTLAEIEETEEKRREWYEKFKWLLQNFRFIPGGRIMHAVGNPRKVTPFNCFVLPIKEDSLEAIFECAKEMARTYSHGGGVGCIREGALVVSRDGIKPIEDVQEGEEVASFNIQSGQFEWRRVTKTHQFEVANEDSVRITFDDGSFIVTSYWHPTLVYAHGRFLYKPAEEVKSGDLVISYSLSEGFSPKFHDPEKAWLVGAYLGDGCAYKEKNDRIFVRDYKGLGINRVKHRVKFAGSSFEVVSAFANGLNSLCGTSVRPHLVSYRHDYQSPVYEVTTNSYSTSQLLELSGWQIGRKARYLRIPSWIWSASEETMLSFLAGLVDTDGSVEVGRGRFAISTSSQQMCWELKSLLSLLGANAKIRYRPRSGGQRALGGRADIWELSVEDASFAARLAKYIRHPEKKRHLMRSSSDEKQLYFLPDDFVAFILSMPENYKVLSPTIRHRLRYGQRTMQRKVFLRIIGQLMELVQEPWMRAALRFYASLVPKLRRVKSVQRGVEGSTCFYDLTVEGNNNYLAGFGGFYVVHNTDISVLRPAGSPVRNAARTSTGAVSFMELYSMVTGTIGQHGRRGALMITIADNHPDVLAFIDIKNDPERRRVRYANISVRVSDELMEAVQRNGKFELRFDGEYFSIRRTVDAREIWDKLIQNAWACVPYETLLFVWKDGQRQLMQIGDLVKEIQSGCKSRYEVLSLNLQTLQLELKPVVKVYEFVNDKRIYECETESGKVFVATEDHLVYRLSRSGQVESVPISCLNSGDFVAIAKTTDIVEDENERVAFVNLQSTLKFLASDGNSLCGEPILELLRESKIRQMLGKFPSGKSWRADEYLRLRYLPVREALRLMAQGIEIPTEGVYWKPSRHQDLLIPLLFPVDEVMAEFLGLWLAEGTVNSYGVRLFLHKEEAEELKSLLQGIAERFNAKWRIERQEGNWVALCLSSKTIRHLLHLLGVLKNGSKDVPEFLFQSPPSVIAAFLRGYFSGDGCVEQKGTVTVSSVSLALLEKVQRLLLLLGIHSRIGVASRGGVKVINGKRCQARKTYRLTIYQGFNSIFAKKVGFLIRRKQELLEQHIRQSATALVGLPMVVNFSLIYRVLGRYIRQRVAPATILRCSPLLADLAICRMLSAGVQWEKVVQVRPVKKRIEKVYDITVANNHTFVLANGWVISNSAEPGCLFWSTIKRYSTSEYNGMEVITTNPCVTGDTLVSTDEGLIPIAELAKRNYLPQAILDSRVSPHFASGAIVKAWKSGRKPVYRVVTRAGYEIRATADHKILTANRGWVQVKDLRPGDLLLVQNRKGGFGQFGDEHLGRVLGWLIADGHANLSDERAILDFYAEDKALAPTFAESVAAVIPTTARYPAPTVTGSGANIVNDAKVGADEVRPQTFRAHFMRPYKHHLQLAHYSVTKVPSQNRLQIRRYRLFEVLTELGFDPQEKHKIPPIVWQGSEAMVRGFLRALFTADGTVLASSASRFSIRLTSVNLRFLKDVQLLLANFGIACRIYENRRPEGAKLMPDGCGGMKLYGTQPVHELVIDKDNIVRFYREIGFLPGSEKQAKLERMVSLYSRGPYRETFTTPVAEVIPEGVEDVYDLTEAVSHTFIANGLVVSNCGEEPLPAYGNCNLGNINLSAFVLDEFTDAARVDWENLERAVRYAVRFLDNVITYAVQGDRLPLPQQKERCAAERRIGVGFTGLGDMLAQLRLKYDSDDALEFVDELFHKIKCWAYDESVNLAIERGPFPLFDAEKHLEMGFIRERLPRELQERIRKHGLRNVCVLTVPPVGSGAAMAGVTSGIEPIFALSYIRRSESLSKGEFKVFHPCVRRYMQKFGIEDERELPDFFVTAHQIAPEMRVRMQAIIQSHIDQSISSTVNLPHDITTQEIERIYFLAWKLGCKGITVYREGSREGVLVTEEFAQQKRGRLMPKPRPMVMVGKTYKLRTEMGNVYVTVNADEEGPQEVFVRLGKSGSSAMAFTEAIGRLISLALRAGVSPDAIVDQLSGIKSSSATRQENGAIVFSVPDAVAKALEMFLKGENPPKGSPLTKALLQALTENNETELAVPPIPSIREELPQILQANGARYSGDLCPNCGEPLIHSGGCELCLFCGYSRCQ